MSRPRRVLDCGYGCGLWCTEVADAHPDCQTPDMTVMAIHNWICVLANMTVKVIGVDINPRQPDEVPDNLYLQLDDLNRRFTFSSHNFDLVHSHMMVSGIHTTRWTQYMRDMFRVTRPGGWCQMVEMYLHVQSDNGTLTDDHALRRWSDLYFESHEGLKDLRVPLRLPAMMREASFEHVEHRMVQLHTCAWSNDERDNAIGAANRENVQRMLSALAIYPFTERLGMAIQDVQLLVAQAKLEASNPAFKVTSSFPASRAKWSN
ncbi:S-adenosyl-L-methionine-dependent methyltransferase [Glarea lozoyensis ATCC 20868]|uniref:S-adenosyl-L-methionine-dependent methyltransferase n=1 Tax=Glarea lozoyensis (strain ATCC 20868 / MF5171) TaxID=1116229 RepID=S3DH48_GLAL2|nr:S-adenosyl-L-methionine-dependent methyltransferase [Glarea lozoyensis ATCC 20868]EPE31336.1 S-adenosyl-L-methionine-dependent methyltransferase [Glarea lozoyensis ATCC 20868]